MPTKTKTKTTKTTKTAAPAPAAAPAAAPAPLPPAPIEIRVWTEGTSVRSRTPFHPDWPPRAKKMGGRYEGGGTWVFDARSEALVREACREIWGSDGEDEAARRLLTLRITFVEGFGAAWLEGRDRGRGGSKKQTDIYIAGRLIGTVRGRDSGAELGPGVVILEGNIGSAGSRKNPGICVAAGTVVELRDVFGPKALEAAAASTEDVKIQIDLAPPAAPPIATDDLDAYVAERTRIDPELPALIERAYAKITEVCPEGDGGGHVQDNQGLCHRCGTIMDAELWRESVDPEDFRRALEEELAACYQRIAEIQVELAALPPPKKGKK
jgi:hypothetical protein